MVEYAMVTARTGLQALFTRASELVQSVNWLLVAGVAVGLFVLYWLLRSRA